MRKWWKQSATACKYFSVLNDVRKMDKCTNYNVKLYMTIYQKFEYSTPTLDRIPQIYGELHKKEESWGMSGNCVECVRKLIFRPTFMSQEILLWNWKQVATLQHIDLPQTWRLPAVLPTGGIRGSLPCAPSVRGAPSGSLFSSQSSFLRDPFRCIVDFKSAFNFCFALILLTQKCTLYLTWLLHSCLLGHPYI